MFVIKLSQDLCARVCERAVGNEHECTIDIHCVRQAGAGAWSWSGVREKHYYLAGGWRLEWCEKKIL